MNATERAGFLAHSRLPVFGRRVAEARDILAIWHSQCQQPYVAFSGGKDSTVLLALARALAPDIPAMFSDDEFNLPETLELVASVPNLHRIAARIMHADWFWSWEGGPDSLPPNTEWVEARNNDGAGTWAALHGYDGTSVGLRAEENNYRRVHIRTYGTCFFVQKRAMWQAYPLANWTVADIWAFIVSHNLPYNHAYDRLTDLGVPREHQRIGPFANRRALPYGQLAVLRRGWPEQYRQFAAQFPEAEAFT